MKNRRLSREFFARDSRAVASELIGKKLVHIINGCRVSGLIVETEAYIGPQDRACHASRGKTKRTAVMFGPPGIWYVYMIYGFYFCLNVVTGEEGHPAAVLIRALAPMEGINKMQILRQTDAHQKLASGPGKLCQALGIDKSFNETPATGSASQLFVEDSGLNVNPKEIVRTRRIGVDYAGSWAKRLLRFYLKENINVSKL